jgi:hypothetical protein
MSTQRPIKPTAVNMKPRGINTTPMIIGIVRNPITDKITPVISTADNDANKLGFSLFIKSSPPYKEKMKIHRYEGIEGYQKAPRER